MSQGPDGDLYLATHGGFGPYRYRFRAVTQYVVVSKTNVWRLEDGAAAFNVRLAMEPASTLSVRLRRPVSAPLTMASGASLTFEPSNWSAPQVVTLASARDDNRVADVIALTVSSSGGGVESVASSNGPADRFASHHDALTVRAHVTTPVDAIATRCVAARAHAAARDAQE